MKTAVSGCPGFLWEHCGYHRALYTLTSWLDTPELSTYHDLWLFGKERSPSRMSNSYSIIKLLFLIQSLFQKAQPQPSVIASSEVRHSVNGNSQWGSRRLPVSGTHRTWQMWVKCSYRWSWAEKVPAPALGLGEFGESEQKPVQAIHIIFFLQFSPSCGDHKGGGDGGQTGFILFFFLYCMDLILWNQLFSLKGQSYLK